MALNTLNCTKINYKNRSLISISSFLFLKVTNNNDKKFLELHKQKWRKWSIINNPIIAQTPPVDLHYNIINSKIKLQEVVVGGQTSQKELSCISTITTTTFYWNAQTRYYFNCIWYRSNASKVFRKCWTGIHISMSVFHSSFIGDLHQLSPPSIPPTAVICDTQKPSQSEIYIWVRKRANRYQSLFRYLFLPCFRQEAHCLVEQARKPYQGVEKLTFSETKLTDRICYDYTITYFIDDVLFPSYLGDTFKEKLRKNIKNYVT